MPLSTEQLPTRSGRRPPVRGDRAVARTGAEGEAREMRLIGSRRRQVRTSVALVVGSIVECEADVIVNSANTDLIMGTGVAAAILHEAGPEAKRKPSARVRCRSVMWS